MVWNYKGNPYRKGSTAYVNEYIAAHGNHDVKGAALAKLILARTDGGWDVEEGTTPIRFFVKCTENNPRNRLFRNTMI